MNKFVFIITGTAGFLLGVVGCSVGKDYERPDPFQGALSEGSEWSGLSGVEGAEPADLLEWWKGWENPELFAWIELALQQSPTLEQAEARILEARAGRLNARSRWWPNLNLYGDAVRNRLSENGVGAGSAAASAGLVDFENSFFQTGFDASWEIDVFGGTRRAAQAGQARLESSEARREAARLTLASEVARAWLDWRYLQLQLDLQNQQVAVLKERQDLWNRKLELGLCSEIDFDRRMAELRSAEAETPAMETNVRSAKNQLMALAGIPANQELPEDVSFRDSGMTTADWIKLPELGVGAPAAWLLRRPDLKAAERDLAAAVAETGVAKAEWYPRFFLIGTAGLESGSLTDLFMTQSRTWTIGPSVRWSIFQGGRIRAGIQRSQARAQQALARYKEIGLIAITEVETGIIAAQNMRTSKQKMEQAENSSQKAWLKAEALHKHGLIDPGQALELQLEWLGIKRQVTRAGHEEALALVSLCKALGGGWEKRGSESEIAGVTFEN